MKKLREFCLKIKNSTTSIYIYNHIYYAKVHQNKYLLHKSFFWNWQ